RHSLRAAALRRGRVSRAPWDPARSAGHRRRPRRSAQARPADEGGPHRTVRYAPSAAARRLSRRSSAHRRIRALGRRRDVKIPGPQSIALGARLRAREERNVTFLAEDFPIFWSSARGAIVTDVDGNEYVDCTAAFGVAGLGHG